MGATVAASPAAPSVSGKYGDFLLLGDFSTFVRALRADRGLTLRELAVRSALAKSTLSRWEAGKSLPRLAELEILLDALDASPYQRRIALEIIRAPRAAAKLREANLQATDREAHPEVTTIGGTPMAGDLLRAIRVRAGRSIEDVAHVLGVSPQSVYTWERSDAWPSNEHLHTICRLLGAAPTEVLALTAGNAWLAAVSPLPTASKLDSLEKAEAFLHDLVYRWEGQGGATALKDLAHLALQARLSAVAASNPQAKELLLSESAFYAAWLCDRQRYSEAAFYADRALQLAHEDRFTNVQWERAVIVAARCAVYGGRHGVTSARAQDGIEQLKSLVDAAQPDHPEFTAWALSDIAEYRLITGDVDSALRYADQAVSVAERSDNPYEAAHRRLSQARLLLQAGRAGEGLSRLPQSDRRPELRYPPFRLAEQLLHTRLLLAMEHRAEAQDLLTKAYETARESKLDTHEADALALEF